MGNSFSSRPSTNASEANENLNRFETDSWTPTPEEIFEVTQLLTKKGNLPNEINYQILDLAEYWTKDEINFNQRISVDHDQRILFDLDLLNEFVYMKHVFYWHQNLLEIENEEPLDLSQSSSSSLIGIDPGTSDRHRKRLTAKVMKIEWNVVSHDQGWSSYPQDHGTYNNSWTWTEATLYDRSTSTPTVTVPSNHPTWYRVSTNIHARRQPTLHQSIWYPDHPFLIDLNQRLRQLAESVDLDHSSIGFALAAVAKFDGWENTVESIQCSMFYSFT